jgi:hypothetical protein
MLFGRRAEGKVMYVKINSPGSEWPRKRETRTPHRNRAFHVPPISFPRARCRLLLECSVCTNLFSIVSSITRIDAESLGTNEVKGCRRMEGWDSKLGRVSCILWCRAVVRARRSDGFGVGVRRLGSYFAEISLIG